MKTIKLKFSIADFRATKLDTKTKELTIEINRTLAKDLYWQILNQLNIEEIDVLDK